jgi:hypothetical protein
VGRYVRTGTLGQSGGSVRQGLNEADGVGDNRRYICMYEYI